MAKKANNDQFVELVKEFQADMSAASRFGKQFDAKQWSNRLQNLIDMHENPDNWYYLSFGSNNGGLINWEGYFTAFQNDYALNGAARKKAIEVVTPAFQDTFGDKDAKEVAHGILGKAFPSFVDDKGDYVVRLPKKLEVKSK